MSGRARFIRVHNKFVNPAAIAYVDFLESGRAMILMRGLTQEKQNIPVDVEETRRLKAFFDAERGEETPSEGLTVVARAFGVRQEQR